MAVTLLAANLPAMAQRIDGLWDANVVVNAVAIPLRIEIATQGTDASRYLFKRDEKVNPSTRESFPDGNLLLEFASYYSGERLNPEPTLIAETEHKKDV